MYSLTLSREERKAIDWIGGRYAHGIDLYEVIWGECKGNPEDVDWDYAGDITFEVPESAAWKIHNIGEESEFRWDCFAPDLANKLTTFCEQIV